MRNGIFIFILTIFASTSDADCMLPAAYIVQARVLSCASAQATALEKIVGKKYSDAEAGNVKHTANYVTIADVELVADVELISSSYRQNWLVYKGKVTPITSNARKKYMILGTTPDDCEKFYKGKLQLLRIDSQPFYCCRDQIVEQKETTAQCLIGLPRVSLAELKWEDLKPAEIKVLPETKKQ